MPPLDDCLKQAAPGEMVELALPPLSINVLLNDKPPSSFTAQDSLVPDQYVVPIPLSPYPRHESLKAKDLLRRPTNSIKRLGYFTHGVELGFSCTFHKVQVPFSNIQPRYLYLLSPFFPLQGKTIDRLIIGVLVWILFNFLWFSTLIVSSRSQIWTNGHLQGSPTVWSLLDSQEFAT
jgi:hypothetical protein